MIFHKQMHPWVPLTHTHTNTCHILAIKFCLSPSIPRNDRNYASRVRVLSLSTQALFQSSLLWELTSVALLLISHSNDSPTIIIKEEKEWVWEYRSQIRFGDTSGCMWYPMANLWPQLQLGWTPSGHGNRLLYFVFLPQGFLWRILQPQDRSLRGR